MKKVLVINASVRSLGSHSRRLTEVFVDYCKNLDPTIEVTIRDVGSVNVPHITQAWITAAFKPKEARSDHEIEVLKSSDIYISELREADVIVLGSPMYNWSIPSTLKAYIDQVLRVNETWIVNSANTKYPYLGLFENKTLFLLLSRGSLGYEKGGYNEHMDFQSHYLKTVFNIMGISNIHMITINGASMDGSELKTSIEAAHRSIRDLIDRESTLSESKIEPISNTF